MAKLTHFDAKGNAAMVDVSAKDVSARVATAKGSVVMAPETLRLGVDGQRQPIACGHDAARQRPQRHRPGFGRHRPSGPALGVAGRDEGEQRDGE